MGFAAYEGSPSSEPTKIAQIGSLSLRSNSADDHDHHGGSLFRSVINATAARASPLQWPCANCRSTVVVSGQDQRCPVCNCRQVKIRDDEESKPAVWLERVCSPATVKTTPSSTPTIEILQQQQPGIIVEIPSIEPVTEEELDDEDEDEDLEEDSHMPLPPASGDSTMMMVEDDGRRPMNPVAATLAAVPSPVPTLAARPDLDPQSALLLAMNDLDKKLPGHKRGDELAAFGSEDASKKRRVEAA